MSGKVISATNDQHLAELVASQPDLVVKFGATWCAPCKQLAPVLAGLAAEHIDVTFVDVDVDTVSQLSTELQVSSVPTLVRFHNGQPTKIVVGFQPATRLKQLISA
jgi:thioredoxin 1